MAYKFSVGKYSHSGSLVSADSLTVSSGSVTLPDGTINTNEIASGSIVSGSIAAGAVVNGHIADGTISNGKLVNTGSVLGSTAVVLGSTVSTIQGLAALSASNISGGIIIGDGNGLTNLTASSMPNFTADVRRQVGASGSGGLQYDLAAGLFSLSSSVGGQGLAYSAGVIDVQATGAVTIISDKVAISDSLAGLGLSAVTGAAGVVSSIDVNRAGAIAILGGDAVAITSSIAGTGLNFSTGAVANAVTTLSVAYGAGAGQAVQGNTAWTASAGNGLTGDVSGTLGAPVSFTFAVGAGNGIEVAADSVAVKLSGGVGNQGLVVNADGLDLKQTIDGNRTFTGDVTIKNLYVTGTITAVDSTNTMIQDPIMLLGSASIGSGAAGDRGLLLFRSGSTDKLAMFWDESLSEFAFVKDSSNVHTDVTLSGTYANLHVGGLITDGGIVETVQTLTAVGNITSSVCLVSASAGSFTATLPVASGWNGKFLKVKRSDGDETRNVVIDGNGSETIDGALTITLDSPYAAVTLLSNGSNWFVF